MMRTIRNSAAALAFSAVCSTAHAVPQLQLGIEGGSYDTSTQTIIAGTDPFNLWAFLTIGGDKKDGGNKDLTLTDTLYIAMAVVPKQTQTTPGPDLGYITVNGTKINVTSDMSYGTPPLDACAENSCAGLGDHGVYATYYYQTDGFTFTGTPQFNQLNTQDDPDLSGLTPGTGGMYGYKLVIDTSGLLAGYAIHFDLYNSEIANKCKNATCDPLDYDAIAFAPFSHDAQSSGSTGSNGGSTGSNGNVPEPASSSLVGLGLGLLGFGFMRRRKQGV